MKKQARPADRQLQGPVRHQKPFIGPPPSVAEGGHRSTVRWRSSSTREAPPNGHLRSQGSSALERSNDASLTTSGTWPVRWQSSTAGNQDRRRGGHGEAASVGQRRQLSFARKAFSRSPEQRSREREQCKAWRSRVTSLVNQRRPA